MSLVGGLWHEFSVVDLWPYQAILRHRGREAVSEEAFVRVESPFGGARHLICQRGRRRAITKYPGASRSGIRSSRSSQRAANWEAHHAGQKVNAINF